MLEITEIWANIAVCVPLVYMSPQNLQTDKPSNFIRRISSWSLLWKGRGLKLGTVVPGGLGKVPEHRRRTAMADHCRSKGSEKEARGEGQQGRGLRMKNNSFADKLRGNTVTSWGSSLSAVPPPKMTSLGCEHPGSRAAGVCQGKDVVLSWKSVFRGGWHNLHKGALITTYLEVHDEFGSPAFKPGTHRTQREEEGWAGQDGLCTGVYLIVQKQLNTRSDVKKVTFV